MHKILVVDDNEDTLYIIRERLKREGFTVTTTKSGNSAIALAIEEKPDLILLDIMMPDINGLEVCRQLANNPETNSIPVIFISARVLPEDLKAGFEAGAKDYIRKPIEKLELIERIKSAVKQNHQTRQQLEIEKAKTFTATVVTANHKLKQPLTLINLAVTSIKRLIGKQPVQEQVINEKLDVITNSVSEIKNILNQLLSVDKLQMGEYLKDIPMINLPKEEKTSDKSPD